MSILFPPLLFYSLSVWPCKFNFRMCTDSFNTTRLKIEGNQAFPLFIYLLLFALLSHHLARVWSQCKLSGQSSAMGAFQVSYKDEAYPWFDFIYVCCKHNEQLHWTICHWLAIEACELVHYDVWMWKLLFIYLFLNRQEQVLLGCPVDSTVTETQIINEKLKN